MEPLRIGCEMEQMPKWHVQAGVRLRRAGGWVLMEKEHVPGASGQGAVRLRIPELTLRQARVLSVEAGWTVQDPSHQPSCVMLRVLLAGVVLQIIMPPVHVDCAC